MLKRLSCFMLALFCLSTVYAKPASIAGNWVAYRTDGEASSIVRITEQHGQVIGKIVHLLTHAGINESGKCDACEGNLKNAPLVGLTVLWGFTPAGDGIWGDGHVLERASGKTYRCDLKLSPDGNTLYVRGSVGFLSKTVEWRRAR